jgi:hypothetical protein
MPTLAAGPPQIIYKTVSINGKKHHSSNFKITKMIDKEVRQFSIETKGG